jgi:hypothetical protein
MINLYGERTTWLIVSDHDPELRELADRHYSRKTRGAKKYVGPGEYLALITPEGRAGFIWRKTKIELRKDGQEGIECTLFRNEAQELYLSSHLILEAEKLALIKWPESSRFFTYVNPKKIKSTYPGFTFIKAGYRKIGTNKSGKLIILEKVIKNE